MKQIFARRTVIATAMTALSLTLMSGAAQARCDKLISPKAGEVNLIGNSFPALAHIAKEMESCSQNGVKVQFKMTPNARPETEQAFAVTGPVAFTGTGFTGGSPSTVLAFSSGFISVVRPRRSLICICLMREA